MQVTDARLLGLDSANGGENSGPAAEVVKTGRDEQAHESAQHGQFRYAETV